MFITLLLSLLGFSLSLYLLSNFSFIYLNKYRKSRCKSSEEKPVSIVICAHNEAKNLHNNLPKILQQELKQFEVIVVNDHSTDETQTILEKFQLKFPRLKSIQLSGQQPRKRQALLAGVEASKFNYLLFTDADCQPSSPDWANLMTQNLSSNIQLILGVSPYKTKASWLNSLIQLETTSTAIQYINFARLKNAYMGVGRNLAVVKSAFVKYNRFNLDQHLQSGDDDMLIQRFTKENIDVQTDERAFTESEPKTKLKQWIIQKQRHYTTAPNYHLSQKLELGVIGLAKVSAFISIIGLSFTEYWLLALISLITIWSLQIAVFINHKSFIKSLKILLFWPILELNLVILQLYILILNQLKPPKYW